MILKQYYLGCLAHASYLLGDEASSTAIVVDPQRDIQKYLADAEKFGLQIRHVFLTHFHADFVAGHLELRDRCGATIHLGSRGQAEYAFLAMKDGDTLDFPDLRLQVLETPGHTIESISILVFDLRKDQAKPHAVLTGDTLFIGDVGRPDLRASLGWTASDLGARLYDSLHNKLLTLCDETLVYPAHGAGSLCGKQLSSDTVSSLGDQRRLNYALQPMSKEEFIRLVTADQPEAPPYFTYDAILNTREHATLEKNLEQVLHPIDLAEVLRMGDAGAQILDVRDAAEYAKGHLAGSINIGLGGQYATWAGTVLDRARPIVIIAEPAREQEAAMRLGRIGFDHVKGYLNGGMEALGARPDLVWPTERISAPMMAEELASADPPLLLDVRNPREWAARHIDGSVNVPLNHLQARIAEIPRNRRVAVHCAGGYRSSIAVSILQQYGITNLIEMAGGLATWDQYLRSTNIQSSEEKKMSLRINDEAPDFSAETTQGAIKFHEWMSNGWAILFSHPKDFTPVCTTELGYMAGLQPEFAKRNCKVIGLSVDPVSSHGKWAADIEETQGHRVNYPMIGDPELKVAKLYDMLPADAGDTCEGRTAANNATVRTVYVIGPDKKIKLMLSYPMSTGRNFDEVLRVLDSIQLTAVHKVATPANWKHGGDVIILPTVSDEEAKQKYPGGWKSPKPYLRIVSQPC